MEALEENISSILTMAGLKQIRVASKSIRSVDVLKHILNQSDQFQGIMCFSAEEAIYLHEHGFNDLLIAYPVWDESQLLKISKLVKENIVISLMVDSLEHVERLESIAKRVDGRFLVSVDIDLSSNILGLHFGVRRSPLTTVKDVMMLVRKIKQLKYVALDGLMGYDAQIAGVVDAAPDQRAKNKLIRLLKKISSKQIIEKRKQIMEALERESISVRFINGGGTGNLQQISNEKNVTEVTAGSGFFNSHLFDKYADFQLEVAAGFAIEVTRKPKKHIYTCAGGGYVASGAMGKDRLPEIYLPKDAKLTVNEGVGEVQTPIVYKGDIAIGLGDPIILRHSKAGELCERFQNLHVIQNGRITDKFSTYRGDGKCFF